MDISFKITPRILKNTQTLVRLYNTNLGFREKFDVLLTRPNVTFQGQPLTLYAWVISKISPRYYPQVKEVWESPEKVKDLLVEYYNDRKELSNLDKKIWELGKKEIPIQKGQAALNERIMATAALIENTPEGDPQKVRLMEEIRQQIREDLKTPPTKDVQIPQPEPEATISQPAIVERPTQLTSISEPEKPAPGTLPIKEPVSPESTSVIPEKFIPLTLPKTEDKTQAKDRPQKVAAEKKIFLPVAATPASAKLISKKPDSEPPKDIEITEENGVPQWTSPKTGKKYPLKVAGGSKAAVIPMQRPQALAPAPALPKIELPQTRDSLGQRLSALRRFQLPYPIQNFAKNTISFGSKFIIRNTPTVMSAAIGGVVGGALAGPAGIPAGLVGGGLFPKVIKSGVLQKGAASSVLKGAGGLAIKGAVGLSNPVGWAWLALSAPGVKTAVKYAMVAFLAIFALPVIMNLNKSQSLFPPYDTAYSAPLPPGEGTGDIDYLIPIRNTSVAPNNVKAQVLKSWPNAKLEFWDSIIQWSKTNGWNPAFVLTLWVEESGAQHYQGADPIGCTLGENISDPRQKLDASLSCLNKFLSAHFSAGYEDIMFSKFMCIYSEGHYPCVFNRNNFPAAIKDWYTIITGQPAPPTNYVASCPVPGGTISTPSYFANKSTGHCGGSYKYECNCGTTGRRAKAIDVPTNGQDVLLPSIDGKQVGWNLILKGYPVDAGEGGGVGHTFETKVGEDWWYLDILHMQQTGLNYGSTYTSGTAIGKSAAAHAHMTIGKNNQKKPTSPGLNPNTSDCDPGWLASDFLCQ